jgi:16S rRNA (cytidine1402-2'-O)-methyltransferase
MVVMSVLYIVPTPIGNIKDITVRAKEVLEQTRTVLSEDTRMTRKLLSLLNIPTNKNFISFFEHNERQKTQYILDLLKQGNDIALVSDAGTPLLSDPGFPLIREIRKLQKADKENFAEVKIEVLPGATSITTALVASGFPTDKFTFLGFASHKPADKKKLLKSVRKSTEQLKSTYILFETQHRILSTLNLMKEILGKNVSVCLCRELTKMHESIEYGNINEIIELVEKKKIDMRGEMVLIFNLHIEKDG